MSTRHMSSPAEPEPVVAPPPAAAGHSTARRALGGSVWSTLGFGSAQAMRLGSNLILTRLLNPEDFGLMALTTSFLIGLTMFSDMGFGPSIQQSRRGDDQDFLDTAWSMKVIRGAILTVAALALAWPLSRFYDAPRLLPVLPVAAISLLIAGFNPTRIDSAARHLMLRRLTLLELAAQAIGIAMMIAAALATGSVWALVVGNLASAAALLVLTDRYLPGSRNRFAIEPAARAELMEFGKWIFASTICGFLLFQGDRLVLGRVLSLSELGIYNIALFLGTVPMLLGGAIAGRLLTPLHRQALHENTGPALVVRARRLLTAFLMTIAVVMALVGPVLIGLLYDPRYAASGTLLTIIALLQLPQIITLSYDYPALAAGDSRGFFFLQAARATIQMTATSIGAWWAGINGLFAGQFVAALLCYPLVARLARKHGAWDPAHDLAAASVAAACAAAIIP